LYPEKNLVLASWGSWHISGLRVGSHVFQDLLLGLHGGEVNIRAHWVLVTAFTGVDSRCIGTVSFEGLEGVEVLGGTGGSWVPGGVNISLGFHIPELVVVLSELEEKLSGGANSERSGCESRGRGHKGSEGKCFGVLLYLG